MSEMDSKLKTAQKEAEEVKDIMLDNLNKTEERKEKLEDLDQRAEQLLQKAHSFQKTTKEVKIKKRKEYLRSKAGLIALVTLLALVIIIVIAVMLSSKSSTDTQVHSAAATPHPHTAGRP